MGKLSAQTSIALIEKCQSVETIRGEENSSVYTRENSTGLKVSSCSNWRWHERLEGRRMLFARFPLPEEINASVFPANISVMYVFSSFFFPRNDSVCSSCLKNNGNMYYVDLKLSPTRTSLSASLSTWWSLGFRPLATIFFIFAAKNFFLPDKERLRSIL